MEHFLKLSVRVAARAANHIGRANAGEERGLRKKAHPKRQRLITG